MKISCICLYHGRNWMLPEAVESFVRQDHPDKELIVLNDCAEQIIRCDAPGVRVVNMQTGITSVAAKFECACAMASSDWCAPWEDDDISLPFRLSLSSARIGDAACYKHAKTFWYNGSLQPPSRNLFFGSALFDRRVYLETRVENPSTWVDQDWMARMVKSGRRILDVNPKPCDMYFLYRWGGIDVHHDSGVPGADPVKRYEAFHAAAVGNPRFVRGVVKIVPRWTVDYVAMVRKHITLDGEGVVF